ncbi:chemotaxis response regulator protein-glutamate methylesterase [Salinisphaera sp. Q1T1-3]|uniref:protein-glutamate methylesterase/protein-glutamine glutaminase n=1 Tax=Salinisphaera sp. Q1T1-3 TaxID=2321229 RepID=UPI000E712D7E|nr:chemotaxis response regulator protein-glutamate methylesterase [Salinisphaera sp. Q1T1-3]RJS95183.1 chemotaxis response regulator protein-glutamate methylesterase [Salinisphaera sp. Q1T1-3]
MSEPIKVLAVDDSALMRRLLSAIVDAEPDMTMVATAPDPYAARELIKRHNPDVLTLDVEMPRMDGLDFLEKLMRLRPMPVVMVSSLTERGSEATLQALELGAIDFVAKPKVNIRDGLAQAGADIVDKLRIAARARPTARTRQATPARLQAVTTSSEKLLAIGASTGGTEALRRLLVPMPANAPAIVITQHMPAGFTDSFARRLDSLCALTVTEACDGQRVLPGHAYIAPGGATHMRIARSGANYVIALVSSPPVNRHRPAVDVLFHSVAECAGGNAIGILLTGMGDDGADGMVAMRTAGAVTIAQDRATSVVYGMPAEAVARGGASHELGIDEIGPKALSVAAEAGRAIRI